MKPQKYVLLLLCGVLLALHIAIWCSDLQRETELCEEKAPHSSNCSVFSDVLWERDSKKQIVREIQIKQQSKQKYLVYCY